MRNPILNVIGSAILLVTPVAALAQPERSGGDVVDLPREPVPQRGREEAPGEVHTVVRGDTLWELSERFLGNPWYWPKVWSYNPEIENPHWIYPGNRVRFFSSGDEVPTQLDPGGGVAEGPSEEPYEDELETPELYVGTGVEVSGPLTFVPKEAGIVLRESFVTTDELEEAGVIDSSFSDALMLSWPDEVYIKFKDGTGDAQLGGEYVVFRTEKKVDHPKEGHYGYVTKLLGKVRVTELSDSLVTAQITESWDEITRGDLIGPAGEQLRSRVESRPNERELEGWVISLMGPVSMTGEHQKIVIDKGSADGVQPGNTFSMIRRSDPIGHFRDPTQGQSDKYPAEEIASCLAVSVMEKATTCLIINSLREVTRGDKAVMRTSGTGPLSLR